ncbi:MAG: LysM peptidoglycan-binding domain-containing protein [Phycisphaerae bacterium]
MTSDAKVGLLLGLAFIFIIAFIINGLPSFKHQPDNNELTRNMAKPHQSPPGIGTTARRVNREVIERIEPVVQTPAASPVIIQPQPAAAEQQVRFQTELPGTVPSNNLSELSSNFQQPSEPALLVQTEPVQAAERIIKPRDRENPQPATYIVKEGDNLADIAKSVYGPEEGNRRVNVDRIFQANRSVLRSPDQIYVGQKLTIPPLTSSPEQTASVLPADKFQPVSSVARANLITPPVSQDSIRFYVVKEGDHLWKISSEQLGNGTRYTEISKLNKDVLKDEDKLVVGMRLRLPAR